jgi:hypothetical protein
MKADIVPGAIFPDYAFPDHRARMNRYHRTMG